MALRALVAPGLVWRAAPYRLGTRRHLTNGCGLPRSGAGRVRTRQAESGNAETLHVSTKQASSSFDVAIVGGGVIGSSIAYFLGASSDFSGRVLVVEKDPSYIAGSTTLSVGGIRQQFSTPENIEMSLFAADFIKRIDEHLGVNDQDVAVSFVEAGYLFLATDAGWSALQSNHEQQRGLGANVSVLSPEQLAARFPWLRVEDLAGGTLGLSGEGWIDPHALLHGFRRKAQQLGARYVHDEVIGVDRTGSKIDAVRLAGGGRIACGTVVNAAGPRAAQIALMFGVELPVRPRKRQVFVIACKQALPSCPLVVDPTGLYFRPEGERYVCGVSPPANEDPDTLDDDVDYGVFEQRIWPLLAHRAEAFASSRCINAWAGHYSYNTFDQNAIVGRHPEIEGLIFANGFSGHGLQQSPAIGRAVSELIAFGEYRTSDLSRLGFERIAAGRAIREVNVV